MTRPTVTFDFALMCKKIEAAEAERDKLKALNAEQDEEFARLQDALAFWLPNMPSQEHPLSDRIAKDAYLLCGVDGNNDEPSAYAQGLIDLVPGAGKLKALNAELAAALQVARTEIWACRHNIAADLHKGNTCWEGVPEILKRRLDELDAALAKNEGATT